MSTKLVLTRLSKYDKIIEKVFKDKYRDGMKRVPFEREDLPEACDALLIPRIKNLGDIPYSYRFRKELPETIKAMAPKGCEWIIVADIPHNITNIQNIVLRNASPTISARLCDAHSNSE